MLEIGAIVTEYDVKEVLPSGIKIDALYGVFEISTYNLSLIAAPTL